MKTSCSTLVFESSRYPDLSDTLNRIRGLGFSLVDVAAFQNWQGISPARLVQEKDYFDSAVRMIKESGLEVSSINSNYSVELINPDDALFRLSLNEFEKIAELAVEVGSPNVTVQAGNITSGMDIAKSMAILEKRAAAFGEIAKKKGVTLGIEGHQGSILEDVGRGLDLMRRIYPLAGFTYDPSHFVMQGIPQADTTRLLEYTVNVHIRNASYGRMQATMREGELDLVEFAANLQKAHWDKPVSIEYFNNFDDSFAETLAVKKILENA